MQAASLLSGLAHLASENDASECTVRKLPAGEKQLAYYEGLIETRQNAWHYWESHPRQPLTNSQQPVAL